jgi:hypothetical protein
MVTLGWGRKDQDRIKGLGLSVPPPASRKVELIVNSLHGIINHVHIAKPPKTSNNTSSF